ncbi:carbohydrate kinase family protein, partial [Paracoccus litorisediminis]
TFGQDDIRCAQAWMAQNQIRTLIRTAAAEGATAMQDGTLFTAAGYAVEVADVTGAGDTFGGTLVHGLEQGWTLQDTLAFAVAAASRSVTQHGPRSGRTTPQNVKNWIQKNQNKKG